MSGLESDVDAVQITKEKLGTQITEAETLKIIQLFVGTMIKLH